MRIFISHSSRDAELARALIDLLQAALPITSDEIRCSSVDGYRLPGGVSIDQRLRNEVHDAELVIGLLTPNSLRSAYVSFELGARWGAQKRMIPLLASGITPEVLEGPLGGINALDCGSDGQIHQLVEETASHLNIEPHRTSTFAHQVNKLLELTSTPISVPHESLTESAVSQHLETFDTSGYGNKFTKPDQLEILREFCATAYKRWEDVVANEPTDSPSRFPRGYYEMGFALIGAVPAAGPVALRDRLRAARRIKLSGWSPFLDLQTQGWDPYVHDNFVEAWTGRRIHSRPAHDSAHCDFWRASLDGKLYTIRGYVEDDPDRQQRYGSSEVMNVDIPIIRLAEGILFAHRLSAQFEEVKEIAIQGKFTGLQNRSLLSLNSHIGVLWEGDFVSTVRCANLPPQQITVAEVHDNLPQIIFELLNGFYAGFGFYELSLSYVQDVLQRLRPL